MKKFFYIMCMLLLLCGCNMLDMKNTPTKQVERFFNNYQILDKDVLSSIDDIVLTKTYLTEKQKDEYRDILKNHYEKLDYERK